MVANKNKSNRRCKSIALVSFIWSGISQFLSLLSRLMSRYCSWNYFLNLNVSVSFWPSVSLRTAWTSNFFSQHWSIRRNLCLFSLYSFRLSLWTQRVVIVGFDSEICSTSCAYAPIYLGYFCKRKFGISSSRKLSPLFRTMPDLSLPIIKLSTAAILSSFSWKFNVRCKK